MTLKLFSILEGEGRLLNRFGILSSNIINRLLISLFFCVSIWTTPTLAAEAVPGDACSPDGIYRHSGGVELSGAGHMMVCESGTWKSILSFNSSGQITSASSTTCSNSQVLKFDGSKFTCADDDTGGGSGWATSGCTTIGQTCSDGSQYAGEAIYVTDTNQSTSSNWSNAITLCDNLDRHGYTDWYLPSKGELNALYENRYAIGGFTTSVYWSSTEMSSTQAVSQSFNNGGLGGNGKTLSQDVRCVRRN